MLSSLRKYFFLLLILPLPALAQMEMMDTLTKWTDAPKIHQPTSDEAKEPAFWVYSSTAVVYTYNDKGYPLLYTVIHNIAHVNESKSIEDFNKVFIPVGEEADLVIFKARAITPSGKVTEIKKSDLKMISEEGYNYLTVPIEGLEIGSEVEYLYSVKKEISFIGTTFIQSSVFRRETIYSIISPENLLMISKVYNSPVQSFDTLNNEFNTIYYKFSNILPETEERYSGGDADLIRIEYKIDKNLSKGLTNLNSYSVIGKQYYDAIANLEKSDLKEVEKLYKKIKVDGKDDEEKVRMIEAYLKTNFRFEKNARVMNLAQAIKTAIVNEYFCNKVFINLIKFGEVKFEIVASISRFKKKFDPDFESPSFLDNVLVYFPSLDKYVVPNDYTQRLGTPGFIYCGNYGLFIKEVSIGDIVSATSTVRKIKEDPYGANFENLIIDVNFSDDFKKIKAHYSRNMKGENARGIRPIYYYVDSEKKKEFVDDLLKMSMEGAVVTNTKVSNDNINTVQVEAPFIMEGDVEVSSVLERADDIIIFKVGALIGPQVEIYDDKKRQSPIEIEFIKSQDRKITINIPQGYEAKGLDALKFVVVEGDAKDPNCGFESSYTLNGNKLEITLHEYYKKVNYPLSDYAQFREVINASADFNKASFVLEKK